MRGVPSIVIILMSLLGVGGLIMAGAIGFLVIRGWLGVPLFAQAPTQPIAFTHMTHTAAVEDGGLGLECAFCHRNVEEGAAATIPSVQQCMFCHSQVTGTTPTAETEIAKLRDAADAGLPVNWVRVYRVPDHVQFVHDVHIRFFSELDGVTSSQVCSTCHGAVETMTTVGQVRALKMGDCVDCHRQYNAPTDCVACHY